MNINNSPVNNVKTWYNQQTGAAPKPLPDGVTYEKEIKTFNDDFKRISSLDNKSTFISALGFGIASHAADEDPTLGTVDIPNLGSLKKTADGFRLQVIRHSLHGFHVGTTTYDINEKNGQINASQDEYPIPLPGGVLSTGSTTTFTLDTNKQEIQDYQFHDSIAGNGLSGASKNGGLATTAGLASAQLVNE